MSKKKIKYFKLKEIKIIASLFFFLVVLKKKWVKRREKLTIETKLVRTIRVVLIVRYRWEMMVSWTRSVPIKLLGNGQILCLFWSTANEIHLVFVRNKKKKGIKGASKGRNLINWKYTISNKWVKQSWEWGGYFGVELDGNGMIIIEMVFQSYEGMNSPRNYEIQCVRERGT